MLRGTESHQHVLLYRIAYAKTKLSLVYLSAFMLVANSPVASSISTFGTDSSFKLIQL